MEKHKGRKFEPIPTEVEQVAKTIVDAAFEVHRVLGPGLLESVYEDCLAYELRQRGTAVNPQVVLPVTYKGIQVESGVRLDLLVQKCVIVEIKAVDKMIPLYEAQLLTYLKISSIRLGFLINFNVHRLKDGIKRMVV